MTRCWWYPTASRRRRPRRRASLPPRLNAVLRSDVRAGSRVLVIGLGALGSPAWRRPRWPAPRCASSAAGSVARQRALRLGAAKSMSRDAAGDCAAWADVVIVTTNTWVDSEPRAGHTAIRAPVAVLGFPGRGQPATDINPLDSRHFYMRQLRIEAVGYSPERADGVALRASTTRRSRFSARTHRPRCVGLAGVGVDACPGTALAQAYNDLLARRCDPITYVLRWNPD